MNVLVAFTLAAGLQAQEAPTPQEPPPGPSLGEEGPGQDFLDLGRMELGLRFGLLAFSEDFESDPQLASSLFLRAPSPWLSRDVFGLEEDDLGAFLMLTVSRIDREVDPEFEHPEGNLVFAALGLDCTFARGEIFLAQAQLGFQYGYYGDVSDTENGVAILLGLLGGIRVAEDAQITLNPQVGISDAGDQLYFVQLGFQIGF